MVNIDNLKLNGKTYHGNSAKFGVIYKGVDCIVKLPKEVMSVYSEYVASNFIRSLNIPCQQVGLGTYNSNIVNIIVDFTFHTDLSLHSYKDTKQSTEDKGISEKEYTYSDVLYLLDKHLKMTDANKTEAKIQFWDMFICDAILANRDRHWGNWGYFSDGTSYKIAPIYDNGASLFPNVDLVINQYITESSRKDFLYERIFVFPASVFKIKKLDRCYKTNYNNMLSDLRFNRVFAERVKILRNKFTVKDIFHKALNICCNQDLDNLSYYYKRFYIQIITMRYACLVCRKDFDKVYNEVEGWLNQYEK